MPYTEFDAADLMEPSRTFASASVDPIVCCTNFRDLSTSPNSDADATPSPTSGAVTAAVIFVPTPVIPSPTFSTLFQAFCAFFVPAVSVPIVLLKEDVKLSIRLKRTSTSFFAISSSFHQRLCFSIKRLIFSCIIFGYLSWYSCRVCSA